LPPGVDLRQAALSNATGETSFTTMVDEASFSCLRQPEYAGQLEKLRVRTARLDDSLPTGYVPFIKVDVEGAGDVHGLLVDEVGLRIFDTNGTGPYSQAGVQRADLELRSPRLRRTRPSSSPGANASADLSASAGNVASAATSSAKMTQYAAVEAHPPWNSAARRTIEGRSSSVLLVSENSNTTMRSAPVPSPFK
jgi:hypothetical protein